MGASMDLESRERFAAMVQRLRGDQSLTAFGAKFDVSHATVKNWESGRHEPNRERLAQIAKYAGYTPDDFLALIENKPVHGRELSQIKTQIKSMALPDLICVYNAVGERLTEIAETVTP